MGCLFGVWIFFPSNSMQAQPPNWSVEPSSFQYNANITGIFLLDEVVNEDTANVLGAFVNNEVRGVARIIFSGGGWKYFLTVYSNALSGDTVKFQMYVATLDSILTIKEKIRFLSDSLYGDPINPMQLHGSTLPEQISLQLQLQKGWNLVAIPLTMTSYQKALLFPTASSDAFSYSNGYQAATTLSNGVGYWIKFEPDSLGNPQSISLQGFPRTEDTLDVKSGWNLIGSITSSVVTGTIIQLGTTVQSSYYGFKSGYQQADIIQPGNSYWVKVSTDGKLVLQSHNGSR